MRRLLFGLLVLVAVLVATVWASEYGYGPLVITKEGQQKLVLRFGDPVQVLSDPGRAFRVPWLDQVRVFDSRVQYLDAEAVEMLIAGGDKLIIDYYVLWRIADPLEFYKTFPQGMSRAEDRIQEIVNGLVGARSGTLAVSEILARAETLSQLDEAATERLVGTGVEVVDVQINRTELPRNAEPAAYQQMREQRRALSREQRAIGDRNARIIRAEAEREARTTVARARSEGQTTRGEGDAQSARIYADAYNRDPEFYAFVRSLQAYRRTLGERTTMVLPPDHEFFRYLAPGSGKNGAGAGTP